MHQQTVEAVLKKTNKLIKESLSELTSEKKLIQILTEEQLVIDPADYDSGVIIDTILSIQQIEEIQRKNGEEGCNRYIISNSEDVYSVLFVFGLMRWIFAGKIFLLTLCHFLNRWKACVMRHKSLQFFV